MASIKVSSRRIGSMFGNRKRKLESASKKLRLSKPLEVIVHEDTWLDFEDLQSLAKYFNKPWSYFLPDEPEIFTNKYKNDNRTFMNKRVAVGEEIIDQLENAEFLLDTAIEVFPNVVVQRPKIGAVRDDAKKLAAVVREFLRVTIQEQLGARDEYAALRAWSDAIQSRGVYVTQRHLDDETIRAFSVTHEDYAVIVVDTIDTPYARIFSTIHEYCHVILNTTGLCDFDEHSKVERLCNTLTSYILLPDDLIHRGVQGLDLTDAADIEVAEKHLVALSARYRVSQAALLIRLNEALLLDDGLFERLEIRRRNRRAPVRESKGGDYYATAISSLGKKYATNVFEALSDKKINRTDASVLLGVGEHLVSRFRDELSSRLNGAGR